MSCFNATLYAVKLHAGYYHYKSKSFLFLLEPKSRRHNPIHQIKQSIPKPVIPPTTKPPPMSPPASTSKIALMPPTKQALNIPPLPPPKPTVKPLPPVPPLKPSSPMPTADPELLQDTNGLQDLPSPLRSPDDTDAVFDDGGAAPDNELEVGSMVEVNDPPLFGVIRWIGRIGGISEQVAGIELVRQKPSFVAVMPLLTKSAFAGPGNFCWDRRQLPRRTSFPLSGQQRAVCQASQLQKRFPVSCPGGTCQSSGKMQLCR